MIGREERAASSLARVLLQTQLKIGILRDEAAVGSIDLARVGVASGALALQTLVLMSPGHFRPAADLLFALFVTLATAGSLAASLLVGLPRHWFGGVQLRRALGITALVVTPLLALLGLQQCFNIGEAVVQGTPYSNDGAVMDLYAASRVLEGQNPYTKSSIIPALAAMNVPATTTTPLMDGQFRGVRAYPSAPAIQQVFLNFLRFHPHAVPAEFESKYNYPSGSFLVILPFVWAGFHDMRFLYVLAILGIGYYLWKRMPRSLRYLAPMLVLSDVPLLKLTAGGQPDPVYGLFLLVGYGEMESLWLSPIAMGLAVATKQLAWFFVPFYLLLVIRRSDWREAGRRLSIMAGVFLLLNGPFILESPGGYLGSIIAPMVDPMFPLGIGIVALFVANIVPMVPKIAFSIAELGSWLVGMFAMARYRSLAPAAGAALAAIPLFFAWRSLVNYFYLVPLLALAFTFANADRFRLRERS